jgi:hypothetical protein
MNPSPFILIGLSLVALSLQPAIAWAADHHAGGVNQVILDDTPGNESGKGSTSQTRQITVIQDMSPPTQPAGALTSDHRGGAGDSYYGTGVYKSTDSGRTWDRPSGTQVGGQPSSQALSNPTPPAGPVPIPYPNIASGGEGGFGPGRASALGSLRSVGSVNDLFANSRGGDQGSSHVGGATVALGDGSVRDPNGKPGASSGTPAGLPAVQSPYPTVDQGSRVGPASLTSGLIIQGQPTDQGTHFNGVVSRFSQGKTDVGANRTLAVGGNRTPTVK